VKGEGSAGDEGVDEDGSWTDERMRTKWEDVWMERRQEVDEERETCPRGQHQHEAREDEMWVETRSKG